jgi:uncharacterized membrane protein YeiH
MEHHNGNFFATFCGVVGGMIQYFLIGIDAAFWTKTGEALITAFLCGIVGAFGKHIYDLIVKRKTTK